MYARMLSRISEDNLEHAIKILKFLAHSVRPLRIEEVAEALIVDTDGETVVDLERRFLEPCDILGICSSLAISTQTGTQDIETAEQHDQMQLAHFSVKEFLVSDRAEALVPQFRIRELDAHVSIAEDCLGYLLSFDQPNFLDAKDFGLFHMADYAARHWLDHARKGNNAGKIVELTMKLFDEENPAYLNFLELFNPDRPWLARAKLPSTEGYYHNSSPQPSPLYMASRCGLIEVVSNLLEGGARVETIGGDCGTALTAACRGGHYEVAQKLLEKGADANKLAGLYGTALQAASFWGHDKIVKLLISAGVDVNQAGGKYANPLQAAAREGHVQTVRTLLEAGANLNLEGGFYGYALQAAAFYGHGKVVKHLLQVGADANQQSGVYGTALQAAARNGCEGIVKDLLAAGAKVNMESGVYLTALQTAARGAHGQTIKLLLDAGADVNLKGGKYGTALQASCLMNKETVVKQLLEAGAEVNANGIGLHGNALQAACHAGLEKIVERLLAARSDVNAKGGFHGYAILAAAKNGYGECVNLLLEAGADVKGWKIWISQSSIGHRRAVKLLQNAGADVDTKEHGGNASPGSTSQTVATITEDFEDVNISEDDVRRASLTAKYCDDCGKPIPDGSAYYHCRICLDDDWDSCEACVRRGWPCRDPSHKMVKCQLRNGMIVNLNEDND
jgi:ankyrin repeat protein